MRGYRFF